MSDLKEFLQDLRPKFIYDNDDNRLFNNIQEELGLFFWKDIKKDIIDMKMWEQAKKEEWNWNFENVKLYYEEDLWDSQISLKWKYCLACLGEEKVKELIKKLEGVVK